MRILVTGSTGFIGVHLCHRLISEGHEIIALVRNQKKAKSLPQKNTHILEGDLSLFRDEKLILPRCEQVIHLAGVVVAPRLRDYALYNCEATKDLVDCLRRQSWKPKRFLFASSLAAAGPSNPRKLKSERDPDCPSEDYGQSKLDAERYLFTEAPFPVTAFRPGVVFGPGDPAFLTIFKMAARGYGIKVARLNSRFSYVYVEDLIDAIVKLTQDKTTKHRTYFMTHPDDASINEIWAQFEKVMNRNILIIPIPKSLLLLIMLGSTFASKIIPFKNQLDLKQYKQMTAPAFICTSQAIQKDFGWAPKYNLADCIEKTAEGYKTAGWLQ